MKGSGVVRTNFPCVICIVVGLTGLLSGFYTAICAAGTRQSTLPLSIQWTTPGGLAQSNEPSKPAPKRQPSAWKLSGSYGLELIYDDNIFRFSDVNIDRFRRGMDPGKYKMNTYDDFILSPSITLDLRRRILWGKDSNLWMKYMRYDYTTNPIKTNETWLLRARQYVWGRDFAEVAFSYSPSGYIREMLDRPPFASRVAPLQYTPFSITRSALRFSYWKRFNPRLLLRGDLQRVWRFYSREFMENDNWEWSYSGIATINLTRSWQCRAQYTYSDVDGRIGDTVGASLDDPASTSGGDSSYEADFYSLDFTYRPRGGFLRFFTDVTGGGRYMKYFFTSQLPPHLDPYHTGRLDEVSTFISTLTTKPLLGPVTGEIGYRLTRRMSNAAYSDLGAAAIEEDKNYINNRTWVGLTYPF